MVVTVVTECREMTCLAEVCALSGLGSSFHHYVDDIHFYVVLCILYRARFMHRHRIWGLPAINFDLAILGKY